MSSCDENDRVQELEEESLATTPCAEITTTVAVVLKEPISSGQPEVEVSQPSAAPPEPTNPSAASSQSPAKPDVAGDEAAQSPRLSSSNFRHHVSIFHTWWVEISSCLVVLGALLAIVGILYPHQNQALPSWPYNISVNALVSILIIIMKGAMLLVLAEGLSQLKWVWFKKPRHLIDLAEFDMASRGPYGSFYLLCVLRGQHIAASVGAFLTLATLAMDPFAQQVVRYYNCNATDSSVSAKIPRTNYFDETDYHYEAGLGLISAGLQGAINIGLFNPEDFTIPFYCPTGNCTFLEKYHTVGYCSACSDITGDLKVVTTNITNGTLSGEGDWGLLFNTTLPSGVSATFATTFAALLVPSQSVFTIAPPTPEQSSPTIQIINAWGSNSLDRDGGYPLGTVNMCSTWGCKPNYGAAQCRFYPCVRTYSSHIHEGRLFEVYEGNPVELEEFLCEFDAVYLPCLTSNQHRDLLNAGYEIPAGAQWISYNSTSFDWAPKPAQLGLTAQYCIYSFLCINQLDIDQFLSEFMSGAVSPEGTGFDGPDVLLELFKEGGVTFETLQQSMANITEAMTKYIRQNGDANFSQPALGVVYRQETCMHVYWWWLSFPVVLVLLTIVFFLATLVETRHAGDWKSSILPLMSYGLLKGHESCENENPLFTVAAMERSAKKVKVQLDFSEKGWRFSADK